MANYIKSTNFTAKDSLPSGDSARIVKGTEIDVEFTAISSAIASKSDSNSPSFTGTPTAPTATAGTNTTQLATTAFALNAAKEAFPIGGIIIWSGSIAAIPATWQLCNGTNGTPDLRDRFIVGAGTTYAVGATGGANTVTPAGTVSGTTAGTALTEAQMPKHWHNMKGPNAGAVPQGPITGFSNYGGGTPDDTGWLYGTFSTGGGSVSGSNDTGTANGSPHTHSLSGATLTGTSQDNRPLYYALCYIQKMS
jgi:hypothetical protein